MNRKLAGWLALAGCVWFGWLYFTSPDATFQAFRDVPEEVTVSCQPLGGSGESRSPTSLLRSDERIAADTFLNGAHEDVGSAEELTRLRADVEQAVATGCEEARLNRLAALGLVGFLTVALLLLALRPAQTTRTDDEPEAETADAAPGPGQTPGLE
jgi:hypothetical protein